jgi:hypothetical protein
MTSQWSFLCPATGQPHGGAWSCGSCFAQNPRPTTSSHGPALMDLVSESESEPEVIDSEPELIDSEPEVMDLEPDIDLEPEVIDLVSESESEVEVFNLEPDVDLDSEVIDLTQE